MSMVEEVVSGQGTRNQQHMDWPLKQEKWVNCSVDRAPTIVSVDGTKQCTQYSIQVLSVDGTLTILSVDRTLTILSVDSPNTNATTD